MDISRTYLTFRRTRVTIQTLPGRGESAAAKGEFANDHMFDHNVRWRVRKQRRKECRRASFPERKGSNGIHAHVTPGSNTFGTIRPLVQIQSLGVKNPLRSPISEDYSISLVPVGQILNVRSKPGSPSFFPASAQWEHPITRQFIHLPRPGFINFTEALPVQPDVSYQAR